MKFFTLCLIFLLCCGLVHHSESKKPRFRQTLSSAWNQISSKFWSVSCEFSTLVSRSKRSVIELPNVRNVDETFEFLYPAALVTVDDVESGKGRSNEGESHGLLAWWDTIKDLWKSECKSRRDDGEEIETPRDKQSNEAEPEVFEDPKLKSTSDSNTTIAKESPLRNSSSASTLIGPTNDNSTTDKILPKQFANETTINFGNATSSTFRNSSTPQGADSKQGLPPIFPGLSDLTLPSLPTPPPLALGMLNNFSVSFGGDIEYFYPLISFGLPFDGEITLLGFHGFKGIFPYK